MKSASSTLLAMLNGAGNTFVMADLYTLVLLGGQTLRYTNFNVDVTAGGNVYSANSLKFTRSRVRWIAGLEVDTLDVTVYAAATDTINGLPFLAQVERGLLDGATLKLERGFMQPGSASAETLVQFNGRVADVGAGRTEARLKVKSDLELLNIQMPRNLYQPGCCYTLYDSGCGLAKASYAVAGTAATGCTKTLLNCGLTQAAGYFDLGTVTFATGVNAGLSRTVRAGAPGVLTFTQPLPTAPSAGDTFTAYAGCDKSQATCSSKFGNQAHFRGMPYIPVPETVV